MADALRPNDAYRVSESVEDGPSLFEAATAMGLEGILAKDRNSEYVPGRRSSQWMKIKGRDSVDCVVLGYTEGKGDRRASFGALQLGSHRDGTLRYIGKVGGGFNDRELRSIFGELKSAKRAERPVEKKPLDDAQTVWLEPRLVCEVRYASFTPEGTLREPVFLRMRPDLDPEDCRLDRDASG